MSGKEGRMGLGNESLPLQKCVHVNPTSVGGPVHVTSRRRSPSLQMADPRIVVLHACLLLVQPSFAPTEISSETMQVFRMQHFVS